VENIIFTLRKCNEITDSFYCFADCVRSVPARGLNTSAVGRPVGSQEKEYM